MKRSEGRRGGMLLAILGMIITKLRRTSTYATMLSSFCSKSEEEK